MSELRLRLILTASKRDAGLGLVSAKVLTAFPERRGQPPLNPHLPTAIQPAMGGHLVLPWRQRILAREVVSHPS